MMQRQLNNTRAHEDPAQVLPRVVNKIHNIWVAWTYPFPSFGKDVWLHRSTDLCRSASKFIKIGNGVRIFQNVWINIAGYPETDEPIIIIEDDVYIQRSCVISAQNQIHIKRNTIFGPSVFVTDHNHGFEDVNAPVSQQGTTRGGTICFEEGSWIGFGAAIVCNENDIVIGRNSVIGANSVVGRSIPPYSVATGNPARVVKQYDKSKEKWVMGSAAVPA